MKSIISWLLGLGIVSTMCVSCSQLEEPERNGTDGCVSFRGTISGTTRATTASFETNDEIGVFAFKDGGDFSSEQNKFYASNVKYKYDGNQFTAIDEGIFYVGDGAPITFRAIYPYVASAGAQFGFTVKEDQSIGDNYTLSDLMIGTTSPTTALAPHLTFNHCLSSVAVDVSFEQMPAGNTELQLTSLMTYTNVDLAAGTFTASGNTGITITAAANGTNSYKAILPPQTIAAGSTFVNIKTEDGHTYSWKPAVDIVLKSGVQKTLRLKVTASGEVKLATNTDASMFVGLWRLIKEVSSNGLEHNYDFYVAYNNDGTGFGYDEGRRGNFTWFVEGEQLITSEYYEGNYRRDTISINTIELNSQQMIVPFKDGDDLWTIHYERCNEKVMTSSYSEGNYPVIAYGSYALVNGGTNVSEYGFCYSMSTPNPTLDDEVLKVENAVNGIYSASLGDHDHAPCYYRSYVIVDGQIVYGNVHYTNIIPIGG